MDPVTGLSDQNLMPDYTLGIPYLKKKSYKI
jgi:hypothetical protein